MSKLAGAVMIVLSLVFFGGAIGGVAMIGVGVAGSQEALLLGLGVELHVAGLEPDEGADDGLHVVVIHEVGAVAATALGEISCGTVEDALTALAVDAVVIRAEVGGVEQPCALLGRVLERDPLM